LAKLVVDSMDIVTQSLSLSISGGRRGLYIDYCTSTSKGISIITSISSTLVVELISVAT
jgi:hypothetical protein